MDPILIRQLNQNLICSEFKSPEEVVDYMGASSRLSNDALGGSNENPKAINVGI